LKTGLSCLWSQLQNPSRQTNTSDFIMLSSPMLLVWLLFIVCVWIMFEPVAYVNASAVITVWAVVTGRVWDPWTQIWGLDIAKSCVPQ
jgi:hypothetical protein